MPSLFKNLFRVSPKLENLSVIARATLLQYILWIRGFTLVVMFTFIVLKDNLVEPGLIFALVLNAAALIIAKTKRFEWGAYLVNAEICIAIPLIATAKGADKGAAVIAPIWLACAPLISSLVLSTRETLLTVVFTFVGTGVIFIFSDPVYKELLNFVLMSVIAFSILALMSVFIRQKFEVSLEEERAKLTHTSKLASMGEMAAGVAHELNSPLSAIVVAAEMIEDELNAQGIVEESLVAHTKIIFEVSERMRKIISGLKTFSKDASSESRMPVEVKEWIINTFNLCQERFQYEGISLSLSHLNLDKICHVQAIQSSQVLLNLLTNASEAVAGLSEKWIRVSVEVTGPWVEVCVIDSGRGIPDDTASHMFDPFFSTKDYGRGIGLGLSISHEIMQKHGGELLYRLRNSNTCFVMRFPIENKKINGATQAA